MMGSFLTRGLVMVFGYAYPAYECFKTVEKNKPEIEQLRFWCQYWILVAVLTVFERVGDTFVSWLPMYSEAKLAFFVYLWYPKTRGTTYVYHAFLKPYVAKHETEIDRNLLELRARAGDMAVLYWQRAASYGQTRIFEILQFVAAQSASRPGPAQQQAQQQARVRIPPPAPPSTRMATQGPQEQPPPPQAATTEESVQEVSPPPAPPKTLGSNSVPKPSGEPSAIQRSASGPSLAPKTVSTQSQVQKTAAASSQVQKATSHGSTTNTQKAASREPETTSQVAAPSSEDTTTQVNMQLTVGEVNSNPPAQETVMEESIRVTRARLRKNRGTANR